MRTISTLLLTSIIIVLVRPGNATAQTVTQGWSQEANIPSLPDSYIPGSGIAGFCSPTVISDASGNVYVLATINPFTNQADFVTTKYNASGVVQWTATYNSGTNNNDQAKAIALDPAGNVYVTGNSVFSGTNGNSADGVISTVKYSPSGARQWAIQTQYGQLDNEVYAIAVDPSGNVYIAGTEIDTAAFAYDYLVVKLNTNGKQMWTATYNGTSNLVDIADAIALDASGNVYVTGYSDGTTTRRLGLFGSVSYDDYYDFVTIEYNSAGQAQWTNRFNGAGNTQDVPIAIAVDPGSGNVYVTGVSYTSGIGGPSTQTTVACNNSGATLWTDQTTPSQSNTAIAVDPSGNILTAGYTTGNGALNYEVRKYSPAGAIAWTQNYFAGVYTSDGANPVVALVVDNESNAYITGGAIPTSSPSQFTSYNYATVKFNSSGTQDWAVTFNGSANQADISTSIALYQPKPAVAGEVAPLPTLYVTGVSNTPNTSTDGFVTTVQYTQAEGLLLKSLATQPNALDDNNPNTLATSLANYPNPFHGMTSIAYTLPNDSHVILQIFDAGGKSIATLLNDDEPAGQHILPFSSARLASGIYEYRIVATSPQGNYTATKQMIIQ